MNAADPAELLMTAGMLAVVMIVLAIACGAVASRISVVPPEPPGVPDEISTSETPTKE